MSRSFVALAAAAAAAASLAPAHAGEGASRIVDRTFVCEAGYVGGVYQVELDFYWSVPPGSQRRTPTASFTTALANGLLAGSSPTSIYANRLHCKATKARLPLTTRGLTSRSVVFSERFDCFTPRRVLLRMRGEFTKPTTLATASPFGYPQLQAAGPATQTELALGTLQGKPIAYTSIAGAKKARVFTVTDCQED